jgi:hypothetical protein
MIGAEQSVYVCRREQARSYKVLEVTGAKW